LKQVAYPIKEEKKLCQFFISHHCLFRLWCIQNTTGGTSDAHFYKWIPENFSRYSVWVTRSSIDCQHLFSSSLVILAFTEYIK